MNFVLLRICAVLGTLLVLSLSAVWIAPPVSAQDYPNGPVRIIVPYAAGGLTDALARTLGGKVADAIGQPVGPATLPDLYLRWISFTAGVDIEAIPYKGGAAQANQAVYSGEVDVTYMGFGVAAPQIAVGTIKPLVAVGTKRSALMPDLPSLGEEGGDPGLAGYFGLFAPAGTPKAIVARLNAEFAKAIDTPQVQIFYKASTLVAEANSPDEFAAFVKADRDAAAKVFKSIGIAPQAVPQ
jgi:tripartite-type tricarboxylate transporter receptor subunit TctC